MFPDRSVTHVPGLYPQGFVGPLVVVVEAARIEAALLGLEGDFRRPGGFVVECAMHAFVPGVALVFEDRFSWLTLTAPAPPCGLQCVMDANLVLGGTNWATIDAAAAARPEQPEARSPERGPAVTMLVATGGSEYSSGSRTSTQSRGLKPGNGLNPERG